MNDIAAAFFAAWKTIGPMLKANAPELRARLARRRLPTYLRPMRAHCIAVRAADRRITPADILPDPPNPQSPIRNPQSPHAVALTKPLLQRLTAPVTLHAPGHSYPDVAAQLGCARNALDKLRNSGRLIHHRIEGFNPHHGVAVCILHARDLLNPCARRKSAPDPIFGGLWALYADSLPDDFSQTLTRMNRKPKFPNQLARGFGGWSWQCPRCSRPVEIVYLPRGVHDWSQYLRDTGRLDLDIPTTGPDAVPEPNSTFACARCHRIQNFSRSHLTHFWNILVLQLSGGLLFGREVPIPASLTQERKMPYHPRRLRSPYRHKVRHLLATTTWTYDQIARQVGITKSAVHYHMKEILRRENLKDRAALKEKHAPARAQQKQSRRAG